MKKYPRLNLPRLTQRVSNDAHGEMRIWDTVRGAWLVLTPEEWVRRHIVEYLIKDAGVPKTHISQEYPVSVSGMPQRADIVVTGRDTSPLMLIECKAPEVPVDSAVYAQGVRYNSIVGARFLMLTNGLKHFILEKNGGDGYAKLKGFPDLKGYFME